MPRPDALAPLAKRLREMGFTKRSGLIFTIPLGVPDVLGWLGINKAAHRDGHGTTTLHPIVGVRHNKIEELVAQLRGDPVRRFITPTASTPLRYLMDPTARTSWVVASSTSDNAVSESLAASMSDVGLPFMRSCVTAEGLIQALRSGRGHAHQIAYTLPVALLLTGARGEAQRELQAEVDELGQRTDAAAGELRTFIDRFASWAADLG